MSLPEGRPGAGWLQALSKTYRNLPFLPVVSWNPGKKTNVISHHHADALVSAGERCTITLFICFSAELLFLHVSWYCIEKNLCPSTLPSY